MASETLEEKKPDGEPPPTDNEEPKEEVDAEKVKEKEELKEKEDAEKGKEKKEKDSVAENMEKEETEGETGRDEENNEEEEEEMKNREEDDQEEVDEEKVGIKKKAKGRQKAAEREPVTPATDRPTRERKKVERYSLPTPPSRSSSSKALSIEKGRGTQLREIPNVAFKLSKRKPDDNLHLLHTILYGKKAKAQMLKKNIGRFSGFVWTEKEEEKHRAKVKEKLDKCVKEKLIDFCNVLDIPINKSNVKKEELSVKLLEFLESPQATRDVLLADKENLGKKRKVTPKIVTSGEASDASAKNKRRATKVGKKRNQPFEAEEEDKDESDAESEETDGSHEENNATPKEESDDEDKKTDGEEDELEDKKSSVEKSSLKKSVKEGSETKTKSKSKSTSTKKDTAAKAVKGSVKSVKKLSGSALKQAAPTKKPKVEKDIEKDQPDSSKEKGKKQSNKLQAKGSKDQDICGTGKDKGGKKGKAEPTREEMHSVVIDILKEVDFNTATLSDILRQLGTHFGVDLLHRKAEVKNIITDAINNMTDDEEDEGEEKDKENAEKDDKNEE